MIDCIRQKRVDEIRLCDFLEKKPLYYAEIDYTRMPRAYEAIKEYLPLPKVIHIVGTNGKGTTGRFIANALFQLGKSVGHYSSPHIEHFNERIWLNGENAQESLLEDAHRQLQTIMPKVFQESLSYFEYTTFLAMMVYADCEYVVLEAGLGGEHDATNVFEKVLSVITPIGKDHEDFLGSTITEIATTKLRSVTKYAIIAKQIFPEVYEVAKRLDIRFDSYEMCLEKEDFSLAIELQKLLDLPEYLKENLLLSMAVIKKLGYKIKKNLFNSQRLQGRMQKVDDHIWMDVGHNALAAEAIKSSMQGRSMVLVYNSYKDKDYRSILTILRPIIKRVEIIDINDDRIIQKEQLTDVLDTLGVTWGVFSAINRDEEYLVFGSFKVVEAFMSRGL